MPADLAVPDDLALRLFLLGRLAGPEAERVERYLETHPEAADTVRTLAADDTLTSALRDQPVSDDADPDVQTAIARLERLADASQRTTTREDAAESQAEPGDDTEDALTFLAPAQGPDELGRLGGYRVLRVLGVGGMGMVLEADDPKLGRRVAIKVMRQRVAASPKAVQRFLQEARAAAAVEHDHIIPIWYIGEDNGVPYIVMPFLKGESLNARLNREDRLPAAEVVRIGVQAAEGLAAAHDRGLVHRDIKPANLWLEAPRGRVKVLDFGLARLAREDGRLTQSGAIVGTPAFMAPEQARGLPVDARSDLFSLGAVLYRMATGRNPFRGTDTMSMLTSLATDTPADPRALNPDLPAHLAGLIGRLLQKDPANRPQSAREVIRQLAPPTVEPLPDSGERPADFAFDDDATQVEPPRATPEPARSPKRERGRGLTRAGIAVVLLALIGVTLGTYKLVFETKDGTLEVVIADPEADARFKNGELRIYVGDQLKYTVKPSELNQKLPPGEYKVRVSDPNGLDVDTPEFTMKKGGQVTVRVTARPPAAVARAGPPTPPAANPDRRAAEALKPFVRSLVVRLRTGKARTVLPADSLPADPFDLEKLDFWPGNQLPADFMSRVFLPAVADLRALTHVEALFLSVPVTPAELARLAGRPAARTLVTLHVPSCDLTPETLDTLKRFPALRVVAVSGRLADDALLARLKELPDLTGLWLRGLGRSGKVTEAGMATVAALPLQLLCLWQSPLAEPKVYKLVAGMPGLITLDLNNTAVGDAGLAELAGCRTLQTLQLISTPVTDTGLPRLYGLTDLRLVQLQDSKVTADGVKALAAALPACRIEWAGGVIEPHPAADPDRAAAEYVLSVGGEVRVNGSTSGLKAVADLPHGPFRLTGITLHGNRQVTDAGLAPLAGCQHLEEAWLNGSAVTEAGLAHLHAANLRGLHIDGLPVTNAGLARFAAARNLTELNVSKTRVTAAGLAGLDCPNLTKLWAFGLAIGDADVAAVARWTKLEHLSLSRTKVTDAGLPRLAGLTALRTLHLAGTDVTADGVKKLAAALPACQIEWAGGVIEPHPAADPDRAAADWVLASGGTVRVNGQDRDLRAAADLPAGLFRLTGVNLEANPKADDAGLARFERCRHLQVLDLRGTGITDAGLAHLKEVADLRVLYLADTRVSNAGLATFRACTKLEELALDNAPVSDDGLAHVRDCKRLTFVVLQGTKVAGPGLAHLADCKRLRHLDLRETGVGDAALAPFRACRDLRHLYLTGTNVTDTGLAGFRDCRALMHLAVQKTAVTARQVEELKTALPACRIEWDGGVVEPSGRLVEDFFTGTDLAGWVVTAGRLWAAKDGAVVGTAPKGFAKAMSKTVYTAKAYRDFQLSCEIRRKGGHAVVLFRGALTPAGDALTGGQWVLRPGGETLTVGTEDGTDREVVQRPDARADDFNSVVIRVVGTKVTVTLNGKVGYDKELADLPAEGVIGLRYGGPAEGVTFRDLRLVDLTRAEKK